MERALSAADRQSLDLLAADLGRVFGTRLRGLVAYGLDTPSDPPLIHSLALVERLGFDDLAACAPLARTWQRRGLAVPLLLEPEEFRRTLDVFPLEYGDIIAHHVPVIGADLFGGAAVSPEDTRRACEQLAKSQLIHLREGFLETGGDPQRVAALVAASAPPLRALLLNIDRLTGEDHDDVADVAEREVGIPGDLVREIMAAGRGSQGTIADPTALLKRYIDALERVWAYVDTWKR